MTTALRLTLVAAALAGACGRPAGEPSASAAAPANEQLAGTIAEHSLKEAYFGEQHLHTAYSLDAYLGGTRLTPTDAYRFARGETVTVNGQSVTIDRPLDWAAVTDHAEYLGEMYSTLVEGAPGHDQERLVELRSITSYEERERWFLEYVQKPNRGTTPQHAPFYAGPATTEGGWQVAIAAAKEHYQPGRFTTLIAFEWSGAPKGGNLHRNVFFRDTLVPPAPMGYAEINREDGLWAWMAGLEQQGMQVLAIPHNSNASKGMMFPAEDASGRPIDSAYARTRSHFEPLIEMMQIKGNSEVHRRFWAADEFADFENANSLADYSGRSMRKENFVRAGVIQGLVQARALGVNPFQYGFVGGTDSHNGTPSNVAEDNFQIGSHGSADETAERRRTSEIGGWIKGKDLNPGALTGVWAPRNTREDIWDAMKARETFATSGPRIKVRFFGGANLPEPVDPVTLVRQGYEVGLPMGRVLPAGTTPPRFTVHAMKDPDGANLDRIQIIKGWVDAKGLPHERIVDVVWSGDRKPGADGRLPPVGSTVDLATATYANTIGSPELLGSWTDDRFDPAEHALYYVRVLQIPTPRWSTYDAVRAGLPLLKDVPATVQERAWTSPIWYTPAP